MSNWNGISDNTETDKKTSTHGMFGNDRSSFRYSVPIIFIRQCKKI